MIFKGYDLCVDSCVLSQSTDSSQSYVMNEFSSSKATNKNDDSSPTSNLINDTKLPLNFETLSSTNHDTNTNNHNRDSSLMEMDEFYFLHPMSQLSARKKHLLKRQMLAEAYGVDLNDSRTKSTYNSSNSKGQRQGKKSTIKRAGVRQPSKTQAKSFRHDNDAIDSDKSDRLVGLLQIATINPKIRTH